MKTLGLMMVVLVAGCGGGGSNNPGTTFDLAMQDPADAIVNGATQASATTYWTVTSGFLSGFVFELFGDHTGVYADNIVGTVSITWQKLSPANIAVTGAEDVPSITDIVGSVSAGSFSGNISGNAYVFGIAGGTIH